MTETNPAANQPLVTVGFRFARTAICVLVFLASGSTIYWTAARRTEAPKSYRAAATIVEHFPTAAGPSAADRIPAADSIPAFRPDSEAIQRQVLSDESLRRMAVSGRPGKGDRDLLCEAPEGPFRQKVPVPFSRSADLEPIRRNLRLSSESATAGSRVLTIEYRDGDRDQVLRLVNGLARCYADAHRAAVGAMLAQADAQAAQAVQESRRQWQQAEAQRNEFLRQPPPVEHETPKPAPAVAKPRWVDNPLWADLQRAHDELLRRREELLVKRTPLHPEVLVVNDLIAQSEAKMASVPRRLRADVADTETRGRGDAGTVSPGGHAGIARHERIQWEKRRLALDAAVQQARARLDQALAAERTNHEQGVRRAAAVELHLADRCEAAAAGRPVPWRFLPLSLASGLALAMAAGMFFTGLGIDPPATSVTQLQTWLPSPLLGPVPIPAGQGDGAAVSKAWNVRALDAWGAILVVVCIFALAMAFAS
jgi:hypothetical protein